MKHYLSVVVLLLAGFMLCAQTPWLHVEGNKIKDPIGNVVILRGLDIKDLATEAAQTYYPLSVNALIDKITNKNDPASNSPGWYPKIIRFTINPGITDFEAYYTNTLKPAVDSATAKGVYVILDNHYVDVISNDMAYSENFWAFMAPRFRNYSNVVFELFNENSSTTMTWAQAKPYMQKLIDTVRAYAPHNLIFAGSPSWDQQMQGSATSPFSGGNIVYVAHIYPSQFINSKGQFTSIVTNVETALAKNPIVMTEWGFDSTLLSQNPVPVTAGLKSTYGVRIMRWADSLGISWTAWVADNSWSPNMFNSNWTLRATPVDMGGFVKDTLYQKRNDNLPANVNCAAPYLGLPQSLCGLDSVVLQSDLGSAGVTFAWYKNDTLIATATDSALVVKKPGSYKVVVTVSDVNACVMTDSVMVQAPIKPVNLGPDALVTDSITLVADSANLPFTYQWYQNGNLLPNTTYYLKLYDTCKSYYSVKVTTPNCGTSSDTFHLLCLRQPFLGHAIPIPGKIQAEDYDIETEANVAYYTPTPSAGSSTYRTDGIGLEVTSDVGGGYDVGYTVANEWLQYTISVQTSGYYTVAFRVASMPGGGSFYLLLNGSNPGYTTKGITEGTTNISGTMNVASTSSTNWQTWTTINAPNLVYLTPADTLLELFMTAGNFNLNYIDIEPFVAPTGVTTTSSAGANLIVFPNPVNDVLNISGSGGQWQLLNLVGQPVMEGSGNQVDMHALTPGQYVLSIGGGFYKIVKF